MRRILVVLLCAFALTACKKKAPAPVVVELQERPAFITDAYTPDGTIIARFDGELTNESQRKTEDNSRFNTHTITLKSGDWARFVMWGENFDTFIIVNTPNDKMAYNDDCEGIHGTISCVRFQAPVDGTYEIEANAYDAKGLGKYVVYVYQTAPDPEPEEAPAADDAPSDEATNEDAPAADAEPAADAPSQGGDAAPSEQAPAAGE